MRPDHVLATDTALLSWQYSDISGSKAPTILLARANTEIVGIQGIIARPFTMYSKTLRGAWLANLSTLPEWRRFGVGLKLLAAPLRMDLDVVLSVGLSDDVYPMMPALGYTTLDSLSRYIGVVNPEACLGIGGCELPPPVSATKEFSDDVHRHQDSLPTDWDECWNNEIAPHFVGMSRTSEFLKWRYLTHPRFRYQIWTTSDAGATTGMIIFRIEPITNTNFRAIRIIEILGRTLAVRSLIEALVTEFDSATTAFIDWYSSSTTHSDVLRSCGFAECGAGTGTSLPNLLSPLKPEEVSIRVACHFNSRVQAAQGDFFALNGYVSKGDSDMDRPN